MEILLIRRRHGPGPFMRFFLAFCVLGTGSATGSTILFTVGCFAALAVLAPDAAIRLIGWLGRTVFHVGQSIWWRIEDRYL